MKMTNSSEIFFQWKMHTNKACRKKKARKNNKKFFLARRPSQLSSSLVWIPIFSSSLSPCSQHKHLIITTEKGMRKLLGSPYTLQRKAQVEWYGWMAVDCLGDDAQKSSRQHGAFTGFHCLAWAKQSRQTLAVFDKDQTPSTPILPKIHSNSPAWPSPSDPGCQRKGRDTALTFCTVTW